MTRYAAFKTLCASVLVVTGAFAQTPPNTLSTEEAASNYENLFNGTEGLSVKWYGVTGNNQTSYQFTANPASSWIISTENDYKIIEVTSGAQSHLVTRDSTYRNFDLKTEWKVPFQGNSGIFTRFLKIASWGGASGTEAQVVDVNHSDGVQALHRAGTAYDMFPLRTGMTNWFGATGEWNEFRIIAYENRVAHYGKGIKLLEYDMNSTAYADQYAISKYKTFPRYKEVHAGSFYLQHHGETGIKYRSMKAKKLTDATMNPWADGSPYRKPGSVVELIDTLPHAAALYPTVSAVDPGTRTGMVEGLAFSRQSGAVSIRLPRQAEYVIEVRALNGTLISRDRTEKTDTYLLKMDKGPHMRALSISTGDKNIYSGLVSPL
jgi:hypothetical protein